MKCSASRRRVRPSSGVLPTALLLSTAGQVQGSSSASWIPAPASDFTAVSHRHVCSPAQRGHSQHILHHLAQTSGNHPIPVLVSTYISVNYFCGWTSFQPDDPIHSITVPVFITVQVIHHQGKQQIIPSCARAGECFLAAVQPYHKLMQPHNHSLQSEN